MRKSTFQFFCCKNSRLDHACNSIMCDRCMQIWITTGRRSGDQPTEEEKDLQMKTAAEVKKKMKGMTAKERRKLRGGNIRPSRRTLVNSVCSKQTSRNSGHGDCNHSETCSWQCETNKVYLQKSWRGKQQDSKLVSLHCIDCKGIVLNE